MELIFSENCQKERLPEIFVQPKRQRYHGFSVHLHRNTWSFWYFAQTSIILNDTFPQTNIIAPEINGWKMKIFWGELLVLGRVCRKTLNNKFTIRQVPNLRKVQDFSLFKLCQLLMKETSWHANGVAAVEGMQSGKPQLVLHMMFQDLQHGFFRFFSIQLINVKQTLMTIH